MSVPSRSEANLTFSDVSVWMRNFWKTVMCTESVLKRKLFKCIRINVDVASDSFKFVNLNTWIHCIDHKLPDSEVTELALLHFPHSYIIEMYGKPF